MLHQLHFLTRQPWANLEICINVWCSWILYKNMKLKNFWNSNGSLLWQSKKAYKLPFYSSCYLIPRTQAQISAPLRTLGTTDCSSMSGLKFWLTFPLWRRIISSLYITLFYHQVPFLSLVSRAWGKGSGTVILLGRAHQGSEEGQGKQAGETR